MAEELSAKENAQGCGIIVAGIFILSLVIGGVSWACEAVSGSDEPPRRTSSPGAGPRRTSLGGTDDASAREACRHFRNIAGDVSAGILSEFELREKLKEVDRDANVSENSSVRRGARSMLQDITAGRDMTDSVNAMGAACRGIGM